MTPGALVWHRLDGPLRPEGLPWFGRHATGDVPELFRYPPEYRDVFSGERWWVWRLSTHPAGACIRFRTNSTRVVARVETWHDATPAQNMHELARRGFELHVDRELYTCCLPDPLGIVDLELYRDPAEPGDRGRGLTIWLPFWNPARVLAIGLDRGATLEAAEPHRVTRPIVTLGSSITQGASASRASLTWPAQLARRLDGELVNLGATGTTTMEDAIADLLAEVDASVYVPKLAITAWQDAGAYAVQLDAFLERLRRRRPDTPIVVVGPLATVRHWQLEERRDMCEGVRAVNDALLEVVGRRRDRGDSRLHAVDGFSLLGADETDGLTDAVHPNDLGFYRIAERLAPTVQRAIRA